MKRYALCIGVNDHDDPQVNGLFCACNDAEEFAFTLRQQGVDATTMTRRVSADSVYRYLRELGTKLAPGDVFIFFFAGHGKTLRQASSQPDQLFLLPDASAALLAQGNIAAAPGLLSWNVLKTLTDSWKDVKRLFIFDACRLPLDSASMRDTNAMVQFEGEGVFRDFKLAKRTPLQGGVGLAVLNSCTDGQQAEELRNYPGNGHGLLTAALLELVAEASKLGTWLATDSNFAQRLTERMQLIGQRYGAKGKGQTPLLVGEPVPLVLPKETPAEPPSTPPPAADGVDWRICCAKGRLEDFEAFVRQHPTSAHAFEALNRIGVMSATVQAPFVPVSEPTVTTIQVPPIVPPPPVVKPPAEGSKGENQKPLPPVKRKNPALLLGGIGGAALTLFVVAKISGYGLLEQEPAPAPYAPAPAAPVYVPTPAPAAKAIPLVTTPDSTSRFRKLESSLQVAGCEACGEMSKIEAGSFEMGAADGEPEALSSEKPHHRVTLKAFEIGRTAVTQGQWEAVMGANPSFFKDCGVACPVENISWNEAQEFLKKLNQQTGQKYRLPIEAEWEYAARAGTSTAFWWGNGISPAQANYDGNLTYNGSVKGEDRKRTVKADSFAPNAWGLYNVHGNVWQWVQDTYHANYNDAPLDGSSWEDSNTKRVLRGGSWYIGPWRLRSASRFGKTPDGRDEDAGFRIARTL